MIKVSDLRRIKKLCFDKIAQASSARKDLSVRFSPIGADMYECVMCNGEDFARIVADTTTLTALPEIQISWHDFQRVCDLFSDIVDLTVKDSTILFKEGKTKFKCATFRSNANKMVNFKFDFDNAIKINMRDNLVILSDLGNFNKFCLSGQHLMSSDGNIAIINILNESLGENDYVFTSIFPQGAWYFNPNYRIIVSEDKRLATTIKRAVSGYPTQALLNLSKQALSNWFEVDVKEFLQCLEKCAKIDDKVILRFEPEGYLTIKAENKEFADFATCIECEVDHDSHKQEIRFTQRYIKEFCRCEHNGRVRILFDDDPAEYKLRAEKDNLIIYAMGLMLPNKTR